MRRVSAVRASASAEADDHEQEAPFGHEPKADDESEEKCAHGRRPLGIGERGDEERERSGEQRERMGDAVMNFPAEPVEQHERQREGGGEALARNRTQQRHVEQESDGGDQRVAQHEVGERAGANELLHAQSSHS